MRLIGLFVATGLLAGCGLFPSGCPDALLQGKLAIGRMGAGWQEGVVVVTDSGPQGVLWPAGYVTETVDGGARLLGPAGNLVASEGDPIYVGGGMSPDNIQFVACGYVGSEPP